LGFLTLSASRIVSLTKLPAILQTEEQGFDYQGESDLDLEYAYAIAQTTPITLYQVGDIVEGASFNNFLDAIDGSYCTFEGGDDPSQDGVYPDPYTTEAGAYEGPEDCGTAKPAYVISTSYSYDETDLSPAYEARQCAEYAKLGLMGVTVLYSSGGASSDHDFA
jgi:tripeptidyl-peptidase I